MPLPLGDRGGGGGLPSERPGDVPQIPGDFQYRNDPEFLRLQSQFSAAFGAQNFPEFDYQKFLTDPAYAGNIYGVLNSGSVEGRPAKAAALNELLAYFKAKTEPSQFEESGGTIDVEAIYAPLRERISELSAQQLQAGRADISRGAARATDVAQEALAGTGLGRSGVAAQSISGIASEAAQRQEAFGERVRGREMAAQLALEKQIRTLQYQEEFTERGANLEEARRAAEQQYYLDSLQFQALIQVAAEGDTSFWEDWGGVFEVAGQTVALL